MTGSTDGLIRWPAPRGARAGRGSSAGQAQPRAPDRRPSRGAGVTFGRQTRGRPLTMSDQDYTLAACLIATSSLGCTARGVA